MMGQINFSTIALNNQSVFYTKVCVCEYLCVWSCLHECVGVFLALFMMTVPNKRGVLANKSSAASRINVCETCAEQRAAQRFSRRDSGLSPVKQLNGIWQNDPTRRHHSTNPPFFSWKENID